MPQIVIALFVTFAMLFSFGTAQANQNGNLAQFMSDIYERNYGQKKPSDEVAVIDGHLHLRKNKKLVVAIIYDKQGVEHAFYLPNINGKAGLAIVTNDLRMDYYQTFQNLRKLRDSLPSRTMHEMVMEMGQQHIRDSEEFSKTVADIVESSKNALIPMR